jgi:hypothetical protein
MFGEQPTLTRDELLGTLKDQDGTKQATAGQRDRTEPATQLAERARAEPARNQAGEQDRTAGREDAGQEADAFTLAQSTRADIEAQQERAEKAARENASQDKAADVRALEAELQKDIALRSEAAADTFELGGNALDNLSGQNAMFSRSQAKEVREHDAPTPETMKPNCSGILYPQTKEQPQTQPGQPGYVGTHSPAPPYLPAPQLLTGNTPTEPSLGEKSAES